MESQCIFQAETQENIFLLNLLPETSDGTEQRGHVARGQVPSPRLPGKWQPMLRERGLGEPARRQPDVQQVCRVLQGRV